MSFTMGLSIYGSNDNHLHELVDRYGISVLQMTTDIFLLSLSNPILFSFMTYQQITIK
jgi:hypothetical protein